MALDQRIYTDSVQPTLKIDGNEWHLLQARTELSTADTPDYVDMIIVPTESTYDTLRGTDPTERVENGGLLGTEFTLDVDTDLVAGPRGKEITRIFTGNLANLSTAAQGAWEAIAWDPSHQAFESGDADGQADNFLNTEIDIVAASGGEGLPVSNVIGGKDGIIFSGDTYDTAGATFIKASEVAKQILKKAGITDYELNFQDPPGVKVGTQPDGTPVYGGIDRRIAMSTQGIKVQDALDRIRNSTDSAWWFDREGTFHIGAPVPGNPVESYNLQFIKDTSAGKQTPPWQGVQVIGSGVVSEDGWDKTNINAERPLNSQASIGQDGKLDTDKLSKPVYTYRNLEIQTQAEADAVASKIVTKLQEQTRSGKITVIGFPEVRPLDAVQMPATDTQPMGGYRYAVTKVVHKINPSDGFVTDIHVGGLTKEVSTVYNEELPEIDIEKIAPNVNGPAPAGSSGI